MEQHPWLNRREYPFASHYINFDFGRMHYVDEGAGDPIVMIHGNPTWSFMYRELIKGLSDSYRCIAVDLVGFGLSDKPYEWRYRPEDHARNVQALINNLHLNDITFLVHDWGGPIGLSYAVTAPHRVKKLIILNSFMWPLEATLSIRLFSGLLGGPVGRFLIERFNLFARLLMKLDASDRAAFAQVHEHYQAPLATPQDRKGSWVFPRELLASREWLANIWAWRDNIADRPALILWGRRDVAFDEKDLQRWQSLLRNHRVVAFQSGHYLAEEKGAELVPHIREFLGAGSGETA